MSQNFNYNNYENNENPNNENPNGQQNQNQPGGPKDYGKQIGDTVRSALQSGDFSKLKDIGSAVEGMVKSATSNVNLGGNQNQNQGHPYSPDGQKHYNMPQQQKYGGMRPVPGRAASLPTQQNRQAGQLPRKKYVNTYAGVASIVFGVLGASVFGVGLLVVGILTAAGVLSSGALLLGGVLLGAGGLSALLIGNGASKRALAGRLHKYYQVLDSKKGVATISDLCAATGYEPMKVRKDIRKGINKGIMPNVRMDANETCAILGNDAYQMYLETEKARETRELEEAERARLMDDPNTAPIEKFKVDGAEALAHIKAANQAISSSVVGGKIDTLEVTVSKIITYVEKHPEKLPETRKMMSYYLPTTIKMLQKYRQYEAMEVQLANVEKTKQEIEESLDTVNIAFKNLLASLYQEDTMDVSTDIDVLQTMLQQEGLAGRRFNIETDENNHSTFEEENNA